MSLMREIRQYPVPRHAVALWWFGQNGYIFKTHDGTLTSVDLYLTDSCNGLVAGLDLRRKVPVFIPPEEVDVDIYTCTHNHQDHTDPWTIRGLRNKDTAYFVGPHPSCNVYLAENVECGRIVPTWPQNVLELKDVKITGTFALPTDDSDLNHVGYVFEFGNGPKIYVTGDTDRSDLLFSVERQKPEIVITVINGGFNNLSHWEAAELCSHLKPKVAIPCHYDMFPDNSVDPKQFRATLALQAPGVQYLELEHGKPYVFERS
ncbi:MAG: MBL fold metallo-hydrolase [Bryobacteraceae bacterium]|nr:MBL fold metallo-hydrolase [Bryobacteraceae bacterium]MDW8380425.1 MBL fold metallo-hydrolase [Bryobacterales bacterium]